MCICSALVNFTSDRLTMGDSHKFLTCLPSRVWVYMSYSFDSGQALRPPGTSDYSRTVFNLCMAEMPKRLASSTSALEMLADGFIPFRNQSQMLERLKIQRNLM